MEDLLSKSAIFQCSLYNNISWSILKQTPAKTVKKRSIDIQKKQ